MLEDALRDGVVILAPVVAAELLSAPLPGARRTELEAFLTDLELAPTPYEHWARVGRLRASAGARGLALSTPDAHVAQCALDAGAVLLTRDRVFASLSRVVPLRLG